MACHTARPIAIVRGNVTVPRFELECRHADDQDAAGLVVRPIGRQTCLNSL